MKIKKEEENRTENIKTFPQLTADKKGCLR